eukprot:XP_014790596.1 PREDICTED: uncharacterized protein LOC106883954 [Octopus bimaculoides]
MDPWIFCFRKKEETSQKKLKKERQQCKCNSFFSPFQSTLPDYHHLSSGNVRHNFEFLDSKWRNKTGMLTRSAARDIYKTADKVGDLKWPCKNMYQTSRDIEPIFTKPSYFR